jgi:tripartite-type tricarboxylate transporter receptor subunit TctC
MTAPIGRFVLLIGIAVACPVPAQAQDYPTRPVTFVVPYAAGGGIDLLARLLGQKLEKRFGKPFVIENKSGSATVIAAHAVARAAPDGHTILLATSTTMAINASVYRHLPYDPIKDLTPVALVSNSPFVLVVNPALPVHSVADLIKLAKERPGSLNYGSSGVGSFHHLNGELLQGLTGIAMTHIPYRATPPALNDVVAGHVQLMFGDVTSTLPLIREGKVRALGVSTAQRVGSAPDIPPLAEAGLPGFDGASWQMVVAPAGTPKAIVARLNAELRALMSEGDVQQELARRGLISVATPPPDELQQFVKSEILRWGRIAQAAGISGTE